MLGKLLASFIAFQMLLNGYLCENSKGFITNGNNATLGDFPHHAHLQILYDTTLFICGGSLVHYKWVLTAAICVYRFDQVQISLGLVNRENGPIKHMLVVTDKNHVRIHPDYNPPTVLSNDLAMIYLASSKPSWILHDYVGIINFHRSINDDFEGLEARATGFGLSSDNSETGISRNLKYVDMPVISNEICQRNFGTLITSSHLCTDTSAGSTCSGDEGAGLFREINGNRTLIGIGSFRAAIGCTLGHPAVFTRLAYFVDWIELNFENPPKEPDNDNRCSCDCKCHTCPALPVVTRKEL